MNRNTKRSSNEGGRCDNGRMRMISRGRKELLHSDLLCRYGLTSLIHLLELSVLLDGGLAEDLLCNGLTCGGSYLGWIGRFGGIQRRCCEMG